MIGVVVCLKNSKKKTYIESTEEEDLFSCIIWVSANIVTMKRREDKMEKMSWPMLSPEKHWMPSKLKCQITPYSEGLHAVILSISSFMK